MAALTLLRLALVITIGQAALIPKINNAKSPTPIGVIDGVEYFTEESYHYTSKQARDFCVANDMQPVSFTDMESFSIITRPLSGDKRYWSSGATIYLWHTGQEVGSDFPIGDDWSKCLAIYNGMLNSEPCVGLPENMYFAYCARPAPEEP